MIEQLKSIILYLLAFISPKRTYAQHLEDVAILDIFGDVKTFIDIGANNGYSVSNTFLFASKGAKGLCFEPVKKIYKRLYAFYIFNSQIKTFQIGLSNKKDSIKIREDGLLSSIVATEDESCKVLLDKYTNKNAQIIEIQVDTLESILSSYPEFYNTDIVSLDVEGHELSVLEGIDFQKFTTKCFVVETHGKNDKISWKHQDYEKIDQILQNNGYQAMIKNQNNTFWINQKHLNKEKIEKVIESYPRYLKV